MRAGKAVFRLLMDSVDLSDLVGDKVYPVAMAEDRVHPAIVYATDSTPLSTKDRTGIFDERIKIDCYSSNADESHRIAALVYTALDRYEGTINGVNVKWLGFEDQQEGFDETLGLYLVTQNYKMISVDGN